MAKAAFIQRRRAKPRRTGDAVLSLLELTSGRREFDPGRLGAKTAGRIVLFENLASFV